MIRFIDRDKELELLNEEWNSPGAKFIVLYGRRRIGKTSLLNEFCKGKKVYSTSLLMNIIMFKFQKSGRSSHLSSMMIF